MLFLDLGSFLRTDLQFHVPYFEALQVENQLELDQDHLSKVGDHM